SGGTTSGAGGCVRTPAIYIKSGRYVKHNWWISIGRTPATSARLLLDHALWRALLHEAEHVAGDAAHLDLLGALGDPVAAVVAVDVLEGLVTRVAEAAVHLHRAVGRLAAETVRPVVA